MVDPVKELLQLKELSKAASTATECREDSVAAESLSEMVSLLVQGMSLKDASALLETAAPGEEERKDKALDLLIEYGTWVSKTRKKRPEIPYVFAADREQLQLFAAPTKQMLDGAPKGALVVPDGYEVLKARSGKQRRNGLSSILTLLYYRPGPDESSRYLHIERRKRERQVSFDMAAAVWGFASRGRLSDMITVGGDSSFLHLAVEAYELLDVYREDAVRALVKILDEGRKSPEAIPELATRCYWLAEGPVRRVAKAASGGNEATLRYEIDSLAQRVRSHSVAIPSCVGMLQAGQVRRIAHVSGLLDESPTHQEKREIRSRLRKMGFANDADRLVSDGISALRSGNLDLFWEAMEARADGDMAWSDILSQAVSRS